MAFEGASGVGKTRLLRELLARHPGAVGLEEAYATLRPPPPLDVPDRPELGRVERALLRAELARWRRATALRRDGRLVLADTGFLGPLTYAIGLAARDPARDVVAELAAGYRRAIAAGRLGCPDLTVLLVAPGREIARRAATDPPGHPVGLRARHASVGRIERGLWSSVLAPPLGTRFRRLAAGGGPDAVARRAEATLAAARSARPLAPAAGARLAAGAVGRLERAAAKIIRGARAGGNPRR